MASAGARQFRLGCFDVRDSRVAVADESLPLVAEVDGASGAVIRVFTWPLSPHHRGRPVALSVLSLDESVMIASPAAGGIVEISRRTGEASVIPLNADPGALLASADAVWAVASPDWREHATDEHAPDEHAPDEHAPDEHAPARQDRRRPVLWEEPTADDIARHQQLSPQFRLSYRSAEEPGDDPAAGGGWTLAEWRADEGDDEDLGPATSIWHIRAGAARRIEADVEEPCLAEIGGRLAGVGRLPGDPIVKRLSPGGAAVSWRYPGTVIVLDEAGTLEAIGAVPASGGAVWADNGRVWLLGCDDDGSDEPIPQAREVLLAESQLAGPLDLRLRQPVAVIDGYIVDLGRLEPDGNEPAGNEPAGNEPAGNEPATPGELGPPVVRFVPADGGDVLEAVAPGLDAWAQAAEVRVGNGEVWFGDPGGCQLRAVAPGSGGVRELPIILDCRPWMPLPELPPGFDARHFEQAQLDGLREALMGGWRTEEGRATPFIEGVTFGAVDLRGEFPDSAVVARFRASDRPAIQFGRRWPLYDELGNPCDHGYGAIGLMEDVLSGSPGLPPLERCDPDADGVVWF